MLTSFLAAGLLSPFFLELAPEVRSTYVSLGNIIEDRPMQTTFVRAGYDAGKFGRFSIRNWNVSSLTDRRSDLHRHALYHMEIGFAWQYTFNITDDFRAHTEITRMWTRYCGYRAEYAASERTYHWAQIEQSLDNPYVVPYYRFRRCFDTIDYLYFSIGARKRIPFWEKFWITPAVTAEGGNWRNARRVLAMTPKSGKWDHGISSITFRLEFGWQMVENISIYAYVEQYELVGGRIRSANKSRNFLCAHNDWTLGGIGLRMKF